MSVRDELTYKWTRDNAALSVTRTISGDVGGVLDLAIPNGAINLLALFGFPLATLKMLFAYCDQAITLAAGGIDAVQRVAITGGPTGGSFALTKGANTTGAIPWDATAGAVQAALVALASVGAGGVVCTGGPLPATPIDCTFRGGNAALPVALMTDTPSLTGGTTPDVTVTSEVTGVVPDTTIALSANVPLHWDAQGYFAVPFAADVTTLRVTNLSGVDALLRLRTLAAAS